MGSKKDPISCALGQGDSKSGGLGLILIDKVKPPKALMADLKAQFPSARNLCFGTVSVGDDKNPKSVIFSINKEFGGLQKRIVKTLRGIGFREASLVKGEK